MDSGAQHERRQARRRRGFTRVYRKEIPPGAPTRPSTAKPGVPVHGGNRKRATHHVGPRRTARDMRMRRSGKTITRRVTSGRPRVNGTIPDPGENLRIIPLGGVEEVGKNMTLLEYKEDIIIVDCGIQFRDQETPGIDFIIPNIGYLEERKDKIRGMFITHGHLDHIGAIPYVISELGYPPIYSRQFGAVMIQKRQAEFPHLKTLDIRTIDGDEKLRVGKHFTIETFSISHTIPDSMGLIIQTPVGPVVFIEDVRVDNVNGVPTDEEVEQYKRFKNLSAVLLTMDSTSVMKPGFSLAENTITKNIEQIIKDAPSRLIIGTFASQVERIISIIKLAEQYGKKVIIEGRSMKTSVEIAKQLKLLDAKNIIPIEEMEDHPPGKTVLLVTGAQGEEFAVLMRVANKTHKHIRLNEKDTVLLSSSIIPGNEYAITKLKDNLYRQEARIITYLDSDVHASGHGNRGELEWIHRQISYKFFMPLHGHHFMLRMHAELSESLGTPEDRVVVPDNGSIVEITPQGETILVRPEKAPVERTMVDGFSVGDTQEVVIRDRQMLAQDGMFVIVASVNPKTGKLRKSPDIISRGFVYLRGEQTLLNETRVIIKRTVETSTAKSYPINFDAIKDEVTDNVRRYLFQKTAKSPMVIPVIIGV